MIIEGQIHGGLTEAFAVAMGQEMIYDAQGNVMGASFMDFSFRPPLKPRSGKPISRSRHRRIIRSAPKVSAKARM